MSYSLLEYTNNDANSTTGLPHIKLFEEENWKQILRQLKAESAIFA